MTIAIFIVPLALSGAILWLVTSLAVARYPLIGLLLISPIILLAYDVPSWPGLISLGKSSAQYPDIVSLVVIGSTIVKPPIYKVRRVVQLLRWRTVLAPGTAMLCILLAYSLFRGARQYGLSPAVVEARPWIQTILIGVWVVVALRRNAEFKAAMLNWLVAIAALTCVVALIHIAQHGLGSASSASYSASGELVTPGRPLVAGQAIIVVIGATIALHRYLTGARRGYLLIVGIFWVFLLVAQDRSAWVAAIASAFVLLIAFRAARGLVVLSIVVAAASLGLLLLDAGILGSFGKNLIESATNTGTYTGRVFDWQILIARSISAGPATILFGFPFGTGWTRVTPSGLLETFIPHNWYVATYLRVGLVGFASMALTLLAALFLNVRHGRDGALLIAILVCLLAFGWTYNLPSYLAPALGLVLLQVAAPARAALAVEAPATNIPLAI